MNIITSLRQKSTASSIAGAEASKALSCDEAASYPSRV